MRYEIAIAPVWRADARCRGLNPGLFYPERGDSAREPKEICRECPVQAECLEYALTNHEKFGVWGGASERERIRIHKRRRREREAREVA